MARQIEKEVIAIEKYSRQSVLKVTEWHTPCTNYPETSIGTASIKRKHCKRLIYHMEGVDGYGFWATLEPIDITMLQIKGRTWMTDEPINWIGMQRIAEASKGKTLVGGLGLGMICHALAKNDRVTNVDVVERCPDVIKLIKPFLNNKINIEEGDFWNYTDRFQDYDTIIIDIWVGNRSVAMWAEMMRAFAMCKVATNNKASVYIWGVKDPALNPAVVQKKRSENTARRF